MSTSEHLLSSSPQQQSQSIKGSIQELNKDLADERINMTYQDKAPYMSASYCSRALFTWAYPLIKYAKTNQISIDLMGTVSKDDCVEVQLKKLNDSWEIARTAPNQENALFWAVLGAFQHEYKVAMFWNVFIALLQVSSPFILHRLIEFIKYQNEDTAGGITLVVLLVSIQGVVYFISEHLKLYQRMIGVKSTNAMIAMIYEKQFKITSSTNKKFSSGELVNFVQVDAIKLALLSQTLPYVMKLPVLLVICFIVLFVYLGYSFLAGVAVFLVAFLVNLHLGRVTARFQKMYMKKQDARVNTTSESLNNIKMLKLYSWTSIFDKVIASKRAEELTILWKRFQYGQMIVTSLYFFPQILSAVIFSVYIGTGNTLNIAVAFTVLTILSLIQEPLRTLPLFMGQLIEFLVSMKRIQSFISLNELNETVVLKVERETTQDAVEIWSGNFHWGAKMRSDAPEAARVASEVEDAENERVVQEPILKDFLALKQIDLKIKQGEFVCVIGDVGSGKSSLLSSIIGDLLYCNPMFMMAHGEAQLSEDLKSSMLEHSQQPVKPDEAPIRVSEDLTYVQQQPWMQNRTIKDNILFGLELDEAKYKETLKICELKRDLQILPAGDKTEIGEKGINLSGGQKARIGLARAVYADKQIYLMDDPISALDANVKKKIFKNVFIDKFSQKTRVLVTHSIDFLHLVDSIILLKAGKVVFKGSYQEVKHNEYLQELISIHRSHQKDQKNLQKNQTQETQLLDLEVIQDNGVQEVKEVDLNEISDSQSESDSDTETDQNPEKVKKVKKPKERSYSIDLGDMTDNAKKLTGSITTNENDEEARVGFSVYRDYNAYCGGWRQLLYVNLSMTGFITTKVMCDWLVGDWATSPTQHSDFGWYCSGQFALSTLCSFFVFCRVFNLQYFSWNGTKKLHETMIARVLKAPINLYFDITPIGRLMNRFSKDLQLIECMFCYQVGGLYVATYLTLSIVVLSIIVVPWIALLYPVIFGIIAILFNIAIAANKEVNRVESLTKSPLLSYLTESISGNSTIRAFKRKEDFIKQNFKYLNNNINANMWSEAVPLWFAIRVDILCLITMATISVICVTARFRVDPIMLSLLLSYTLTLQQVLSSMVRQMMDIQARMVNVQRLLSLLEIPQEKQGGLTATELGKDWPARGEIEFKNVVLRYRPTTDIVLNQLTFHAKPGEKIGVVGRTGAGKSTICLSLSRIVEIVEGQILIDNVDISTVELCHLRSRITVIPQDPTMFTGTLRFNLDPEKVNNDKRILEVLHKAQLDDLLNRDERGLNMQITESGQNLSSGERQLICICRAILRSSSVVILDEATANIDVVTEQKIQTLIGEEFTNATMITIAHRLNTIIASDKVMVLSFGQILEFDSPANLMSDPKSEFSSLLKEIEKEEKGSK